MPTNGSVSATSTSMVRGWPSHITVAMYTSKYSTRPSARIPGWRHNQDSPKAVTSAGGNVKKPVKPVSITASISCGRPGGPMTSRRMVASRLALTMPMIIVCLPPQETDRNDVHHGGQSGYTKSGHRGSGSISVVKRLAYPQPLRTRRCPHQSQRLSRDCRRPRADECAVDSGHPHDVRALQYCSAVAVFSWFFLAGCQGDTVRGFFPIVHDLFRIL